MSRMNLSININASPETVFAIVSDIDGERAKASGLEKVEILTDGPVGVGTRWREIHVMNDRETVEEMEVTAFEHPHFYSAHSDSQGFDVDWTMRVDPKGQGSKLTLDMTSTPRTLAAKFKAPVAWLMTGMMKKMVAKDLEKIKTYIEQQAVPA